MIDTIKKNKIAQLTTILFIALTGWWISLQFTKSAAQNNWFGIAYGSIALIGALAGFGVSKKWGGLKSYIGCAIAMFSLGLFAQEFGQITYWIYVFILKTDVPYPSIGDIGFFGSIPLYIYGAICLAKASGVSTSMKNLSNKLQAFIIPAILLLLSYWLFLRGYKFDWSNPLTIFLDFGYPLGQAIYISIAILALLFSRKSLGGLMRPKIVLVLMALCVQYAADFLFLYQTNNGTWKAGAISDYPYLLAYMAMVIAILNFGSLYNKLQGSTATPKKEADDA